MARKNVNRGIEEDSPGLDISSLIDVCFLLLIYFIVSTTIEASEQDVNMKLPSTGAPASQDETEVTPLFIKINAEGAIFVGANSDAELLDTDEEDRTVPLLSQRIELYKESCELSNSTPVVQVYIDGEAKQQRAIDCLNAIAKYDIERVTFTDLLD